MKKVIITLGILGILLGIIVVAEIVKFYAPAKSDNKPNNKSDSLAVICTDDAKQCPDGTYVGRTGPHCEFAPCPGQPKKPDFTPSENQSLQLPENVITVEECQKAGGEVWNSLGKTDYEGELIGRIEGMRCPCACLVK